MQKGRALIASTAALGLGYLLIRSLKRAGEAIDVAFGDWPQVPGELAAPSLNSQGGEGLRQPSAAVRSNVRTHRREGV